MEQSSTNYRLIYTALGLALVAVVALAFALSPRGEPLELPEPVEAISPRPNETVFRTSPIAVNMAPNYGIDLYIDDIPIPATEILVRPQTGDYVWGPGPASLIEEWTPGLHTARITWNTLSGLPDVGEYIWTFRIQ